MINDEVVDFLLIEKKQSGMHDCHYNWDLAIFLLYFEECY